MGEQELLNFSDEIKKEAQQVIGETKIEELLSKYGKINYLGGYSLDVMFRRDIDLVLKMSTLDERVTSDLLDELKSSDHFHEITTTNFKSKKASATVEHLEWEKDTIKVVAKYYLFSKQEWKFDIWLSTSEDLLPIYANAFFKKRLKDAPTLRFKILKLKYDNYNGNRYMNNRFAFDIYEGVLGKFK